MIKVTSNLKKIREQQGYTRTELANLTSISRTCIRQIEDGKSMGNLLTMIDLAIGLHVKVGDLIKIEAEGFDITSKYF